MRAFISCINSVQVFRGGGLLGVDFRGCGGTQGDHHLKLFKTDHFAKMFILLSALLVVSSGWMDGWRNAYYMVISFPYSYARTCSKMMMVSQAKNQGVAGHDIFCVDNIVSYTCTIIIIILLCILKS